MGEFRDDLSEPLTAPVRRCVDEVADVLEFHGESRELAIDATIQSLFRVVTERYGSEKGGPVAINAVAHVVGLQLSFAPRNIWPGLLGNLLADIVRNAEAALADGSSVRIEYLEASGHG